MCPFGCVVNSISDAGAVSIYQIYYGPLPPLSIVFRILFLFFGARLAGCEPLRFCGWVLLCGCVSLGGRIPCWLEMGSKLFSRLDGSGFHVAVVEPAVLACWLCFFSVIRICFIFS